MNNCKSNKYLSFNNKYFEKQVRIVLNKPTGPITEVNSI